MEKEKIIPLKVNYFLKESIQMEKKKDMEKNMIKMKS